MQSDETVENAWTRARSQCECVHTAHSHAARCGTVLVWERRGKGVAGGWEAVNNGHKSVGGWEAVKASRILCWDCNRKATADAARQHVTGHTGAADAHHPDRR